MALYPPTAVDVPVPAPPASVPTGPLPVPLVPSPGEAAATKPAVPPVPTASPGPPLDAPVVFISYSHSEDDKKWVEEELEPLLRDRCKCRVCRDDQIPPAIDWPKWITDQIAASNHVLVVLTESSLNSSWVCRELKLVRDEDPDGTKLKLVPLLLKTCYPPADLVPKFIQRIDLTVPDPSERQRQLGMLISVVCPTKETVLPPDIIVTSDDIRVLFRSVEGQKKVLPFQVKLCTACEHIDQIKDFKMLHDGLHELIERCQMIGRGIKRLSGDDSAWEDLEREGLKLANNLEELASTALDSPFGAAEGKAWIENLDTNRLRLEEAIRQHDKDKLASAMKYINRERRDKFNRFNTRLFQAAEGLRFGELLASAEGMLGLFKPLEAYRLDESARAVAMRCTGRTSL